MPRSEDIHEALQSLGTAAIGASFDWSAGALVVTAAGGDVPVPSIKDTDRNRDQLMVHRDSAYPEEAPWFLANMSTVTPDLDSETVGHRGWFWMIRPRIYFSFAHPDEPTRRLMMSAIVDKFEEALAADRTLGGIADTSWAQPPEDVEEDDQLGYVDVLFAALPVIVYYESTRSSG